MTHENFSTNQFFHNMLSQNINTEPQKNNFTILEFNSKIVILQNDKKRC